MWSEVVLSDVVFLDFVIPFDLLLRYFSVFAHSFHFFLICCCDLFCSCLCDLLLCFSTSGPPHQTLPKLYSLFGIKQKLPSTLSTHLRYFHYSTLRFLQNKTHLSSGLSCIRQKSPLWSSHTPLSLHLSFTPLAVNLFTPSLFYCQMKTIAG